VANFSAMSQPFFSVESWNLFPKERMKLYDLLQETNVRAPYSWSLIFVVKFYYIPYLSQAQSRVTSSFSLIIVLNILRESLIKEICTWTFATMRMQVSGVMFISGDVHFCEIARYDCGLSYPLYDFTSSGITQGVEELAPPPLSYILAFAAWLTPNTLRVYNPRCRYHSCVYGICHFFLRQFSSLLSIMDCMLKVNKNPFSANLFSCLSFQEFFSFLYCFHRKLDKGDFDFPTQYFLQSMMDTYVLLLQYMQESRTLEDLRSIGMLILLLSMLTLEMCMEYLY
jgi:hypothetical protein